MSDLRASAAQHSQTQISVGGSLEIWELFALVAAVGAVLVAVAWPFARAWARRLENRSVEALASANVAELDALRIQVQRLQSEVTDLRGRVEFAERILPRPE